jgi:hypothetical protein
MDLGQERRIERHAVEPRPIGLSTAGWSRRVEAGEDNSFKGLERWGAAAVLYNSREKWSFFRCTSMTYGVTCC